MNFGGGGWKDHEPMAALKRQFPDQFKEIMSTDDFLAGATGFWVEVHKLEWWKIRVEHNPAFASDFFISNRRLLHVRRRQ
jgi:hypothetical protein